MLSQKAIDALAAEAYMAARKRVNTQRKLNVQRVEHKYVPRGAAAELFGYRGREVVISGPAGTGKSRGVLEYINRCCIDYPGIRSLLLRKTRASLTETTLVTFENFVLGMENPLVVDGPQRAYRHSYVYPNRSEIVVGGLDRPSRLMSSEYDLIAVFEANEVTLIDWESIGTRLRNGVMPYQQLIGDTNPDHPYHHLKKRCEKGFAKMLESRHEDNPRLWDAEKNTWTPFGIDYIAQLDALTGVRLQRLRYGKWVQAEGAIYDNWTMKNINAEIAAYDPSLPVIWAIDDGYKNPRVILVAQIKPNGTVVIIDEYYEREAMPDTSIRKVLALGYAAPMLAIYDPSAATFSAFLNAQGIQTISADNDVSEGIKTTRQYIKDGNDVISLFVNPKCEHTIEEVPNYQWAQSGSLDGGDPRPIKENDHAADAVRYLLHTPHGLSIARAA